MLEDPLVGTKLDSRYEIIELIGLGAWSRVYKAKQIALGRVVSVKVLQPHLAIDEKKWKRFEQEAKVSSSIKHPNIVNVFDYGLRPQPFIVMEYLQGATLAHRIKRAGPVPVQEALELFTEISDALQAAHEKGLIHRDLKPANVMLAESQDGKTVAKLLDLGLAKIIDGDGQTLVQLTTTGQTLGSPAYMSPEQCTGAELDARSDIYSLGCLMYEVLTGVRAFDADTPTECMRKHLFDNPQPMRSVSTELNLPESLERIVFRALAIEPVERYQSVDEIKQDLIAIAEGKTKGLQYERQRLGATFSRLRRSLRQPKVQATCLIVILLVVSSFVFFLNREGLANAAWQFQYDQGKQLLQARDLEKAETKFKSALFLTRWFGQDDWRTARSLAQLRNTYKAEKKSQEAMELNAKIVKLEKGSPAWEQQLQEAESLTEGANYARAEQLLSRIAKQQRQSPADRLATSFTLIKLGEVYKLEGKLNDSESAFREALTIREKFLDRNDSMLTEALEHLAEICLAQGRWNESQELLQEVLSLTEQSLGTNSPAVAEVLGSLGYARLMQRDFTGAETHYKHALSILDNLHTPDDYRYGPICGGLANLYVEAKKYDLAEPQILRSIAIQKKKFGAGHLRTCPGLTILGNLRYGQERYDDAIACMKQVWDIHRNTIGENNQQSLISLENYIRVVRSKQPELAAKLGRLSEEIKASISRGGGGQ